MTFEEFDKFQAELLTEVTAMGETKGKEYAHAEDRFANFNGLAGELGISNFTVAWIYLKKHLDSIASYVKDNKTYSVEPIRGRIVDAITYLTLIAGMIEEKPKEEKICCGGVCCVASIDNFICELLVNHTGSHKAFTGKNRTGSELSWY